MPSQSRICICLLATAYRVRISRRRCFYGPLCVDNFCHMCNGLRGRSCRINQAAVAVAAAAAAAQQQLQLQVTQRKTKIGVENTNRNGLNWIGIAGVARSQPATTGFPLQATLATMQRRPRQRQLSSGDSNLLPSHQWKSMSCHSFQPRNLPTPLFFSLRSSPCGCRN